MKRFLGEKVNLTLILAKVKTSSRLLRSRLRDLERLFRRSQDLTLFSSLLDRSRSLSGFLLVDFVERESLSLCGSSFFSAESFFFSSCPSLVSSFLLLETRLSAKSKTNFSIMYFCLHYFSAH